MKDIRSIDRGKCLNCHECEEFTGTLRCDYCDCVAAKHIRKQEEEAITGDESNKHFKLDTLEHSGHSDVGLTSLTSGFENLEENCVEEVSNVNDSIFHDGISRLESLISELEKEENEKFNVSCKFKLLRKMENLCFLALFATKITSWEILERKSKMLNFMPVQGDIWQMFMQLG
ncbi:uncharacterized protein [Mytilus edulis]|uniref:uncharacterized protein n=1 Tax=Mytilus edulis TaxID=6550 RepID=UPI0039F0E392